MTFEEAARRCPPGYYFKDKGNGWSEYTVQYGRDDEGKLYWTAGGTTGGPLTAKDHPTNPGYDFAIYQWGQRKPVSSIPSFAEAYERIRLNSASHHRQLFIQQVEEVVAQCTLKAIEAGLTPDQARHVVRTTVHDFLGILDRKRNGKPIFNLSRNQYASPNLSGGLVDLFDKINS